MIALFKRCTIARGVPAAAMDDVVQEVFLVVHRKLDEFVMEAQRVIDAYGGSTLQLTLGDKGAYLYAVIRSLQIRGLRLPKPRVRWNGQPKAPKAPKA